MKFKKIFFSIFFLSFLNSQVVYELDPINVSATRIPSTKSESGKSITIFNKDEIKKLPINSIDELFRFLTGVNVNARNDFGVQVDVGIRGSTFSQVLFLIDNISLNDPLTGHFNANIPLPISEIESIEIIRGPASASYGSNAVGGIIHIKTKSYILNENIDSGKMVSSISYGKNNLKTIDIGFSKSFKKLFFSVGTRLSNSDGEVIVNPNYAIGTSTDSLYNTDFEIMTNTLSFAYFFNKKIKYYLRIGNDKRDFNAKYFYTTSTYDESYEEISSSWLQSGLKIYLGNNIFEFNVGNKILNDKFIFNPLFSINNHKTNKNSYLISYYMPFSRKLKFAFGGQYIYKKINSSDRGNHWNDSKGLFGIIHLNLFNNIYQSLSLRLENDSYVDEIIPLFQHNIAYKIKNLVLRSSIGTAFRSPDFTERYISSQIDSLSPGRNLGNPNLKSEKSISYDIGVDLKMKNELNLSNTIFFRKSSDLIDYTWTNSNFIDNNKNLYLNEDYFYAQNIFYSNVFGLEFEIEKKIKVNNKNLIDLKLSHTQLQTSSTQNQLSKYLSNHPEKIFSINSNFNGKNFQISFLSNYIERKKETYETINAEIPKSYFLNNLKINYFINDKVSIYCKINNLTNTKYQDILGSSLPKRWPSIGITYLN